jgi:uncharacterized membrane protein YtjA (UPF0391 family)
MEFEKWHESCSCTSAIPRMSAHSERREASVAGTQLQEAVMLSWSLVFLVVALIAALLGFTGIAGSAAGIAKILFFVFLVLMLISFITGRSGRNVT